MKNVVYFFLIICLFFCKDSCLYGQSDVDKQIERMLREFYIAHNSAWMNTKDNNILIKKLDSLQKKYCTIRLRSELKQEFKKHGLDHDLLTKDESADSASLKNIAVLKGGTIGNTYSVSYSYHTTDPSYKPILKMVVIHVSVIKEKDVFKIDKVW